MLLKSILRSTLGVGVMLVLSLSACVKKSDSPPSEATAIISLPEAKPVAQLKGYKTKLVRHFDKETGVLCYVLEDYTSSPSCLKVAEPTKPYSEL